MLRAFQRYLRRPANEFVIALCIALAIALAVVSLSSQSPFNQAPNIKAEQQTSKAVEANQNTGGSGDTINPASRRDGPNGSDEATEYWTIFRHKLKITDTLLVLFTFTLWWATQRLVRGSEETAERQLRAYVFGTYHSVNVTADAKGTPFKVMIQYEVRNYGQTPAHRIRNAAYVAKLPWPMPRDFVVQSPKWDDPRTVSLAPGQFMFQNDEIPYEVLPNGQRYYLVALIEYFDVFGQKRTTKLCASGDIDRFLKNRTGQPGGDDVPFEIAPQHNDAE